MYIAWASLRNGSKRKTTVEPGWAKQQTRSFDSNQLTRIALSRGHHRNVQVGNDQEMAQSERKSHSINRGVGKKTKITPSTYTKKTYRKPSEQLFPNRRPFSYPN